MKRKFEIGNRVRFIGTEQDAWGFNNTFTGRLATVTEYHSFQAYKITFDNGATYFCKEEHIVPCCEINFNGLAELYGGV